MCLEVCCIDPAFASTTLTLETSNFRKDLQPLFQIVCEFCQIKQRALLLQLYHAQLQQQFGVVWHFFIFICFLFRNANTEFMNSVLNIHSTFNITDKSVDGTLL